MEFAEPYLVIRALSVVPIIISSISFASFREFIYFDTPLHITLFTIIINIVLHPILMFKYDLGVKGAVVSTLISEYTSAIIYSRISKKKKYDFFTQVITKLDEHVSLN